MKRYLQVMVVLIALQLIVSVMVMWPNAGERGADAKFIEIDSAQITSIDLSDLQNNQLSLKKIDREWRIQQGEMSALANTAQVDNLLHALMTSPAGWPVSTSEEALNRFALADTDYQWKIMLATADNTRRETLYFGNAAGAAKRHARRSGDSTVYALNYALADKLIKARDWLRRDILALASEDIVTIDAGDYLLKRQEESWRLADQRNDEVVDQELVAMFIGRLKSLRIDDVVAGELLAKINAEKPLQTINFSTAAKDAPVRQYSFYKLDDKNYLRRSDVAGVYEISLLAASDLLKVRNQWLIPGKVIAPQKPD